MAEELNSEFTLLDQAVKSRDAGVVAKWRAQYDAWVSGDHEGICLFENVDAFKRKCTLLLLLSMTVTHRVDLRLDIRQVEVVSQCGRRLA
jgi:hypothetical protein